ncbi:MAG: lysylphosphatidylglycerol synthase transmembrane domain-containing protein [Candidatus Omnitrophica bacterium]|nr:lysylphosphatidylglycerol synthase transmembrane domain-containing protein [Candidatus Omnitrophota bacterium]
MKKKIGPFLRTAVSLLLIIILLYIMRGKYGDIVEALKNTNMYIFALAFAAFMLASIIASFRLKLIIEAQDISLRFREALSLTLIGYFFNNFLPTSIGGDVVKAHYLSKHSRDTAGSYTSVFVDRAVGLVTMIFMAFAALILAGANIVDRGVAITIYAITAISIIGIIFLANKKFARKFSKLIVLVKPIEAQLRNLYESTNKYRHRISLMIATLCISVVSQLFYFVCYGILAVSIGSKIPAIDLLLKMPIVSMMSLLPSINGLGVREGSMVVLFGPLTGKENALAIGILMIMLLLITSVIGGVIYALSPQFKMKLKEIKKEGENL